VDNYLRFIFKKKIICFPFFKIAEKGFKKIVNKKVERKIMTTVNYKYKIGLYFNQFQMFSIVSRFSTLFFLNTWCESFLPIKGLILFFMLDQVLFE